MRERYAAGELSYDLQGLRELVEGVMEVAVLGLGEAGGRIAADLVAAGCTVRGWDPVRRPAASPNADERPRGRPGRRRRPQPQRGGGRARRGARVAGELGADTLYADLNTASPAAQAGARRGAARAVRRRRADRRRPGIGLATPALASGAGAERFAELFRPLGMPVEVVGAAPGDAAGLKLLRSVFMKGIAAAAIESLEAARAAGVEERVRADIAAVIGEPLLERLLTGSHAHAAGASTRCTPPPPTSRSSASSRASPRPRPAWLAAAPRSWFDKGLVPSTPTSTERAVGLERREDLPVAERLAR